MRSKIRCLKEEPRKLVSRPCCRPLCAYEAVATKGSLIASSHIPLSVVGLAAEPAPLAGRSKRASALKASEKVQSWKEAEKMAFTVSGVCADCPI
jgi:hypothetical protein